jgi:hypothetical protein
MIPGRGAVAELLRTIDSGGVTRLTVAAA